MPGARRSDHSKQAQAAGRAENRKSGHSSCLIPFIRRRVAPRWVGLVLVVSALWMVVGNLVLAPRGPAANVGINLLSNLGPVLLLAALGQLGQRMWREAG